MPKTKKGLEVKDDAEIEVKPKEVKVYDIKGNYIRTYSLEVHGKKYIELANEFAGKVGGRKVI